MNEIPPDALSGEEVNSGANRDERDILQGRPDRRGYQRLGPRISQSFERAARQLATNGLITLEDDEYFLTVAGPNADLIVQHRQK